MYIAAVEASLSVANWQLIEFVEEPEQNLRVTKYGRGALLVELDDTAKHGIRSAQYFSVAELANIGRAVPNVEAKPISEVVAIYDPKHEFVALIMDVTPTLPGPQLWFEIFPRAS